MFRCGKKFVGDTARTLDKRVQVCELYITTIHVIIVY